jgi:hypothetical protein
VHLATELVVIVGMVVIVMQQAEELVLIMVELRIGNMSIGGTNKLLTIQFLQIRKKNDRHL